MMIELSNFIAITALFFSIYTLWRSKLTAVDQLQTELYVTAHSTNSITKEAISLLISCHENIDLLKSGVVPQEEMNALQKIEKRAYEFMWSPKPNQSEKEIRKQLGYLQADIIYAKGYIKKYEGWLENYKESA